MLEAAPGVLLVEEELDGVCELWLLMSEELLLGEVLEEAAPGVELVEDCDCDDCEPQLELEFVELSGEVLDGEEAEGEVVELDEVLLCGMLLEVESGVDVLPVAPVVLCVLELLPTLLEPVCALLLAEVSGVEDCEELGLLELEPVWASAMSCGGVEVLFGLLEVELELLFGDVELLLGEVEVVELLWLEVEELPEMLPAVFWSDGVAAALPALEEALLDTVRSLSSTFLTPDTDFASFFASFLSSLVATVPLNLAVPLLTEICTP